MHCIVPGGKLTKDHKIRKSSKSFFIPDGAIDGLFRGKYLSALDKLYKDGQLVVSYSCEQLRNSYSWAELRDSLYQKSWVAHIKETFNSFGNALEYLGQYTHKIAISNSRILSVWEQQTVFSARGKEPGDSRHTITLDNEEFIQRNLTHVLSYGFQRIH